MLSFTSSHTCASFYSTDRVYSGSGKYSFVSSASANGSFAIPDEADGVPDATIALPDNSIRDSENAIRCTKKWFPLQRIVQTGQRKLHSL